MVVKHEDNSAFTLHNVFIKVANELCHTRKRVLEKLIVV